MGDNISSLLVVAFPPRSRPVLHARPFPRKYSVLFVAPATSDTRLLSHLYRGEGNISTRRHLPCIVRNSFSYGLTFSTSIIMIKSGMAFMGVRASALCFALFTSESNALVAAMPKQSARPKNKGNGALSVFFN